MNNENQPSNKTLPIKMIFIIVSVLIAITLITYYLKFGGKLSNKQETWGQFGDYVGGSLNPIFSFLSFIALLFTINLQREELEATNKELARSADAQHKSQLALNKQLETQAIQQFENTFFALLDQHNKLLEVHQKSIDNVLNHIIFNNNNPPLETAKQILKPFNSTIGQYFRVLYQLLKLIATSIPNGNIGSNFSATEIQNSDLAPNEKMYSNIVRSFLNYRVTQLLAINCYCSSDEDSFIKFKLLIERYAFLEHMPFRLDDHEFKIEAFSDIYEHYDLKAFGKSQFLSN